MTLTLPISETFSSIQGEGTWTGTPMRFIRLAGCNVGRHPSSVEWEPVVKVGEPFPVLKTGKTAYVCHTYDGRAFYCDTDFQSSTKVELDVLLDQTWERHICLTGGEPLLHADKLYEIADECQARGIMLHIESSGTIKELVPGWLTISPKQGFLADMIDWADEVKLLIDRDFKLADVPQCIREHGNVFVQPINTELEINITNLNLCLEVLRARPEWKLSYQSHKFTNWR